MKIGRIFVTVATLAMLGGEARATQLLDVDAGYLGNLGFGTSGSGGMVLTGGYRGDWIGAAGNVFVFATGSEHGPGAFGLRGATLGLRFHRGLGVPADDGPRGFFLGMDMTGGYVWGSGTRRRADQVEVVYGSGFSAMATAYVGVLAGNRPYFSARLGIGAFTVPGLELFSAPLLSLSAGIAF